MKNSPAKLIVAFTFLAILIVSYIPEVSMWGLAHLHFLSSGVRTCLTTFIVITILLMFIPFGSNYYNRFIDKADNILWGKSRWIWLVVAILSMLVFYLLRMKTYFLGDGYSWLSILGQGENYIHKWAEPGSLYLIRFIQFLMGGYTEETALYTFQLLSVLSGGLVVYNLLSLTKVLFDKEKSRVMFFFSLLFSAHILLYFGYVEFYAMSWAVTIMLMNLTIRFIKGYSNIFSVMAIYTIASGIHLQALYLLPGIVILLIISIRSKKVRFAGYIISVLATLGGVVFLVWLYRTNIVFELLILPPFKGRPPADDYTILSLQHIFDIINLMILMFPGVIFILISSLLNYKNILKDNVSLVLLFYSAGSIAFLLFYGAAITMAFDWDIMSLTLLPPLILVLYNLDYDIISNKTITGAIVLSGLVLISFLNVNISTEKSEARYHTLLNSRHRSSWITYAEYFLNTNRRDKFEEIITECDSLFPDYVSLKKGYFFLNKRDIPNAEKIAREISQKNPFNADFLQFMGNIYGKLNKLDSAIMFYEKAVKLRPYNTGIQNELGQLYMNNKMYSEANVVFWRAHEMAPDNSSILEGLALNYVYQRKYDSALIISDSMFTKESDSPGGHLIRMVVALNRGNQAEAALYYRFFLSSGTERSDYESLKSYYDYLLE